jgi:hypothetical protein
MKLIRMFVFFVIVLGIHATAFNSIAQTISPVVIEPDLEKKEEGKTSIPDPKTVSSVVEKKKLEKTSEPTPNPTPSPISRSIRPSKFAPKSNPAPSPTPEEELPTYLKDRGTGIPTSIFGTYVRKGEVIVYPFAEYYHDNNFEYKPEEFGFAGNVDFRGKYRAKEALIFVTDNISVEMEAATIKATFEKSPLDTSAMPSKIQETGLGDVEGQIRWRWFKENESRPEVFSYAELVIPHNKNKKLIGTSGVEAKFGTGVIKGFSWGTLTFRGAVEYSASSETKFDFGEFAVEYLKRLSPNWRIFVGVEGKPGEFSVIPELQWHINKNVFVKFNSGFGLTSKAPDFTPEVGVVFSFGGKK